MGDAEVKERRIKLVSFLLDSGLSPQKKQEEPIGTKIYCEIFYQRDSFPLAVNFL